PPSPPARVLCVASLSPTHAGASCPALAPPHWASRLACPRPLARSLANAAFARPVNLCADNTALTQLPKAAYSPTPPQTCPPCSKPRHSGHRPAPLVPARAPGAAIDTASPQSRPCATPLLSPAYSRADSTVPTHVPFSLSCTSSFFTSLSPHIL